MNGTEPISCVFVDFFCVTSVNMKRISRDFTLFVLCFAAFFFFLVQVSWTVLQYYHKEKILWALMFEARCTNLLLVLYDATYFLWKVTHCTRILIKACFDRENIEWISTSMVTFQYFTLLRWPIFAIVMVTPYSTIKLVIHFGTFLV